MNGYFPLPRRELAASDPFWGERRQLSRFEAWLLIRSWVSFAPHPYRGIIMQPGEVLLSARILETACQWSYGASYRFLAELVERKLLAKTRDEGKAGTVYRVAPDAVGSEVGSVNGSEVGSVKPVASVEVTPQAGSVNGSQNGSHSGSDTTIRQKKVVQKKVIQKNPREASPHADAITKAVELWASRFGGKPPGGRIGAAVKWLCEHGHPAAEVLETWEHYLAPGQRWLNAEDFQSKYGLHRSALLGKANGNGKVPSYTPPPAGEALRAERKGHVTERRLQPDGEQWWRRMASEAAAAKQDPIEYAYARIDA